MTPLRRLGQPVSDGVARLVREGPLLRVEISNPAGGGAPQVAQGLIDTGASISGIRPELARAAGLIQTGMASISGVTGTEKRPIYAAAVNLPEYGVAFEAVEVAGVDLPQREITFLVGRDLLRNATLSYRGRSGDFSLSDGDRPDITSLIAAGGVAAGVVAILFLAGAFK